MSTYEPIMNALFALLQTQCDDTFRYYSRRFLTWENVVVRTQNESDPVNQPALFLYDGIGFGGGRTEFQQRARGLPPVRTLLRTVVIYAQLPGGGTLGGVADLTTPGGSVFAPLAESVENAFSPEVGDGPGGTQTLGGLVSHCWIEGDSHWVVGDIDPGGQGMLTIPVRIMIP